MQKNGDQILLAIDSIQWYHTIEVAPGICTKGQRNCSALLRKLHLPSDCTGLRALDIGTAEGFFAFELERRGAEVVAIDHVRRPGFAIMKELYGYRTELQVMNIYDLSAEKSGKFDIILFLGVLYHLKNPCLALDIIRSLCRGSLYLETTCLTSVYDKDNKNVAIENLPLALYHHLDSYNQDRTNYWSFTPEALRKILDEARFCVQKAIIDSDRILVQCDVFEDQAREYFCRIERGLI